MYNLLQKITSQAGCVCFESCDADDIKRSNAMLLAQGFCKIPEEYAKFLQVYNGIIYDGMELLGTTSYLREQKGYTYKSIFEVNQNYSRIGFFRQKLIIGMLSESFIIYDQPNNIFAIIDRLNLDSKTVFNSFNEMFKLLYSFFAIKN